jgi:SAM-dependent methyltransferase
MTSAELQGTLWGTRPDDWADNEAMCRPFYDAVFDATGTGPGTRLLDLGCGAGTALVLAEKRGAIVAGMDASTGMLDYARRQLPGADLRQGDIEHLPYADASFDVVTAFNSVGFCDDQVAALREAARVTVPGGRVGVVAWGDPARSDMRVLFAALGPLHPPADAPAHPPVSLESAMAAAGLRVTHDGEVNLPLIYPDLASAVRIQSSSGPARLAAEHSGADVARAAIAGAFDTARRPDGTYRMDNVFRYVIGVA